MLSRVTSSGESSSAQVTSYKCHLSTIYYQKQAVAYCTIHNLNPSHGFCHNCTSTTQHNTWLAWSVLFCMISRSSRFATSRQWKHAQFTSALPIMHACKYTVVNPLNLAQILYCSMPQKGILYELAPLPLYSWFLWVYVRGIVIQLAPFYSIVYDFTRLLWLS